MVATAPLQIAALLANPLVLLGRLVGLGLIAGILAAGAAFVFRWYTRERVQPGLPVLVGLSAVAIYLNTTTALGQVISGAAGPIATSVILFNITAFAVATAAGVSGVHVGDRLGTAVFAATGIRGIEGDVGRVVEAVGRVIAVELPADIDDVVGYDPTPDRTKAQLAGRTFLFPRRLTVTELESRLRNRLKSDYGVGHVDVEIGPDGTVEYLALGARAAGLGPTLPPETVAVAVRADPAFAASAGDLVQVRDTESGTRITTAELRGVAGDVVTLAVDASDAPKLDDETTYRLVTLPVEARPDREFASLLRGAAETTALIEIAAGSPLAGQPLGALDVAVLAIQTDHGIEPLPQETRALAPGDGIYVIAQPDALRKLEQNATTVRPGAAQ